MFVSKEWLNFIHNADYYVLHKDTPAWKNIFTHLTKTHVLPGVSFALGCNEQAGLFKSHVGERQTVGKHFLICQSIGKKSEEGNGLRG